MSSGDPMLTKGARTPFLTRMKRFVAKMLGGSSAGAAPPGSPTDPYAGVREPKWRTPNGRSSAVAVMEPPDNEAVMVVSKPSRAHAAVSRQ